MSSGTGSNFPAQVVAGENTGINSAFQPFPYPNTSQAASSAYSGIANDVPSGSISGLTGAGNSALGRIPGLLNTTSQAGAGAQAAGQAQYNTLAPYVSQALQAGFDPQRALYNQQFQQQQQQNLAGQAMAGVGQSPYAAGLTAQGNQNFNLNWQNQELQRQQLGAQTAEGLSSTALGGLTSGDATLAQMLGLGISGQEGLMGAAGNAFGQAAGLNAQQVAQYLAYLQASTQNAAAATGEQINSLNSGTNLYGVTNQGNLAQQQLQSQQLGGLGSLLGQGVGAGANYAGDLAIAAAL